MNAKHKSHPVGDYALAYVRRFNSLTAARTTSDSLAHIFLVRIDVAICYWASDGVVIFFFPRSPGNQAGVYLYDRRSEPLAHLVQAYSSNLLKVTPPPNEQLKSDLSNLPDLPSDLEQAQVRTGYLNPEITSEQWDGKILLTGVAVAPVRRYENGHLVATLDSRFHLWSPSLRMPLGRRVRQYSWTSADFFWSDLALLSAKLGEAAAENDFHVMRLAQEAGFNADNLTKDDPFMLVSRHLLAVCKSFEQLIEREVVEESEVQCFLEKPAHQFLVAPIHTAIFPRRRLGGGKFIPDFMVQRSDGNWEFVEIEAPGKVIYQRRGEDPAAHLVHAITQVEDWLRFIDENRDTVEREDGLAGIYRPRGRVVAGRDRDLGEQAQIRFRYKRAEPARIRIQTYDLLIREARSYAEGLARMSALGTTSVSKNPLDLN